MNNSKVAIVISKLVGTIQLLAGGVILFFFGICTMMYLFDKEFQVDVGAAFLVVSLIFDAIGIMLIIFSRKRKKLINDFKKYVSAISADPTGSIANLAAAVGTSQDVVKKNLELMIRRKYFVNAYINQETNCVVIRNISIANSSQPTVDVQPTINANQQAIPKLEYISCTCKSCGGINRVVKGQSAECDFCGSPINA